MDNEVQQFKGIYSSQYDLNLDIPVGMNKEQAQERFRIVNDSLQGDERAKWIGKPISWKDQENIIKAKAPQMGLWERGVKELWNTSLDIANMVNKGLWTAGASFGASIAAEDMFREEYYKTHKQPRTPLEKIEYEKAKEEWNKKYSAEITKSAGASEAISEYTDIVEQGKFDIPPAEPWSKEWAVSGGVNVAVPLIGGLGFGKLLELATVYGMGNYSDTAQTILQGGGTLKEATAKGVTSGILETELEKLAINQWGVALGLPRLQRYIRRYATGALQESSQAIKDKLILGDYDTRTNEQFQLDLASALIWGGFGECLGLAIRDVVTKKSQAKLTQGIEKAGADKAVAKEISAGIFLDEKEVDLDKYKDVINERQNIRRAQAYDTLIAQGDSPEIASAKAQDLVPTAESIINDVKGMLKNMPILSAEDIQRGQAFIEEAQRIGGKDADTYANIMNTYRQIGKLGGLTEEEISKDAEYFANAHTSLFLALKDKDPNLTYEQYADKIKLNSLRIIQDINVEREVNKRVKETLPWFGETSELTAEQVDEVERVAQNERYNVMREAGLIQDDTLYSMIGERSKLTKQQKTSLDEAKSLEQDGLLNNEQVRQATGWYRGDDGKWRLEISDKDATLTDIDIKENAWTLGDLLKHKPLFSAIPQMQAVSVRYNPNMTETARVVTGIGGVRLEVGTKYFKKSPQEKRKDIMHEVQHIIQGFEKFAKGGVVGNFRSPRMKLIDKVKWNTRIKYADLIMGMGKWKSFNEVREKIKTLENTDNELLKDYIEKFKQADEYLKEYDMNTAFQKYRRLAGEIEARNVANRIDLTDEERRRISPEETRDIPREQAIIRFDDNTESNYTPEYNPYIVNKVSYKGKEVKPYGKGINGLIATDLAVGKTEEQIKQTARESIDYAQSQLDEINKLIDLARAKLSDEVAKEIEDIVASSEGRWWDYENERSNADEQNYLDLLLSQEDYQDSIKVANKILKADFSDYSVSSIDGTLYSRSRYDENMDKRAKDYFGTTKNVKEAGYILKNGEMLDFSGKNQGARGGYRTIDHREIKDAFDIIDDGEDESLVRFVNNGNIRFMPEENAFFMANKPTSEQMKIIKNISDKANGEIELELYNNAEDWNDREKVFYRKYEKGTDFKKIERDINGFYYGNVSKANQFLYSRYNASYSDAKKIIRLFKGHNPQALVHELSHNFFMDYFRLTEEYGLTEKNKAIYDMLGKDSYKKFGEREWETITEEFMKYLKTNEAPNIALKGLFDRAKDWLIETFFTTNKSETPSPEVKEFFESLVSSGVKGADITDLRMTPRTIGDILKSIKSGNEVSFKGVRRADLKRLRNALHQTMPRKAKTLAEEMRKDDMQIKADSELAKQLGYDSKKKNPVFSEKGTVERIDELDDYLVEKGLLSKNLSETAEQVSDRENEIENIIYQAEQVYTPEEQKIADTRDAIYNNQLRTQELVDDILKDNELGIKNIDELNQYLDKAIETAKESDSIMVNQEAINFLIDGYKNAERLYEKTKKDLEKAQEQLKTAKEDLSVLNKSQKDLTRAQDINGVREQLMGYIRALPISAKHRLSLMDKVKQVKKGDDFTEVLGNINDSFKKMWEQETKEILANNINTIIKSTKPKERRKQKYNYDYNTLFEEFRKINSMNKSSAEQAYFDILDEIKYQLSDSYVDDGVREEMDRVKRMLVSYKMNGRKDSSVALMRELEKSLFDLRQDAIEDKARTDTEKAIKKRAEIDRAVDYIQGTKKAGGVLGFYLKNTNLYSNESELFGSDWAREHEMETVELEQSRLVREKTKRMIEKGKRIYGIPEDTGAKKIVSASDKEFARLMNEKSQEIYSLHGVNDRAKNMDKKISLLQIMDIYNTIKNKNSAEIYAELYESFDEEGNQLSHNIQDLIDNLSDQDKAFADAIMADIQSLREAENKTYVKLYGIDMTKHENYYPRSAEKVEGEIMDIKKFAVEDNTPSFFKERAKRSLLVPRNMWTKYQSRINDSMYMTHTFEKYKEHYDLIHNLEVKNAIESKYDSKRYASLNTSLKDLSLGGNHSTFDEMENVMGNMVSNWVVSKIAMNDAVFGKQLISFTNYMENMPITDFFKYEAEFWANPTKAIKFMKEFDGEYLNQRFSEGMQNEALAQIMTNAERSIKKRDYIFQDYIDFVTLPVRLGDVGAIYIGGYARVKYLLDHGVPLDEARKTFEFESVRSQQSGLKSSMAQFQKNTAVKFFSAFKNTQLQYQRKLFDGWIQWRRNEISTEQYAKMAANYMFLQSFLYQVASNVFSYWRDDDDDKELEYMKDVPMQIITSPIAGVPLVGEFVQNLLAEKDYDLGVAGLQDLNRARRLIRKFNSEMQEGEFNPKTAEKAGALLIQFVKPLPANILNNILTE